MVTNVNSAKKTITRQNKDGSWNFIIPRFLHGGTILGGTKEPGDWSLGPSRETHDRLLEGGRQLVAESSGLPRDQPLPADLQVIADVVARRPTRDGGMRIEVETRRAVTGSENRIIHAYGAGGRGYEISWGVANEVLRLAEQTLYGQANLRSKL